MGVSISSGNVNGLQHAPVFLDGEETFFRLWRFLYLNGACVQVCLGINGAYPRREFKERHDACPPEVPRRYGHSLLILQVEEELADLFPAEAGRVYFGRFHWAAFFHPEDILVDGRIIRTQRFP